MENEGRLSLVSCLGFSAGVGDAVAYNDVDDVVYVAGRFACSLVGTSRFGAMCGRADAPIRAVAWAARTSAWIAGEVSGDVCFRLVSARAATSAAEPVLMAGLSAQTTPTPVSLSLDGRRLFALISCEQGWWVVSLEVGRPASALRLTLLRKQVPALVRASAGVVCVTGERFLRFFAVQNGGADDGALSAAAAVAVPAGGGALVNALWLKGWCYTARASGAVTAYAPSGESMAVPLHTSDPIVRIAAMMPFSRGLAMLVEVQPPSGGGETRVEGDAGAGSVGQEPPDIPKPIWTLIHLELESAPLLAVKSEQVISLDAALVGAALSAGEGSLLMWSTGAIWEASVRRATRAAPAVRPRLLLRQPVGALQCSATARLRPWLGVVSSEASEGATLLVTDYETARVVCEVELLETPECIAIHPLGHAVAQALGARVTLAPLLQDELGAARPLPVKRAHLLRFSRGGAWLAAAAGSAVHVFDALSGELVTVLRGHAGSVTDVEFTKHDTSILTTGLDGGVYEWSLGGRRLALWLDRGVQLSCPLGVLGDAGQADVITTLASDKTLRVLTQGLLTATLTLPMPCQWARPLCEGAPDPKTPAVLLASASHNSVLLWGPLGGPHTTHTWHDTVVMSAFLDEGTLVTVGQDGLICVGTVGSGRPHLALQGGTLVHLPREAPSEALIGREALAELRRQRAELEAALVESASAHEFRVRALEAAHKRALAEAAAARTRLAAEARAKEEALRNEKLRAENEWDGKLTALHERHASETAALEQRFEGALRQAEARLARAKVDKEVALKGAEAKRATLQAESAKAVGAVTARLEENTAELARTQKQLARTAAAEAEAFSAATQSAEKEAVAAAHAASARAAQLEQQLKEGRVSAQREAAALTGQRDALQAREERALEGQVKAKAEAAELRTQITALKAEVETATEQARQEAVRAEAARTATADIEARQALLLRERAVLAHKIDEYEALIAPREAAMETHRAEQGAAAAELRALAAKNQNAALAAQRQAEKIHTLETGLAKAEAKVAALVLARERLDAAVAPLLRQGCGSLTDLKAFRAGIGALLGEPSAVPPPPPKAAQMERQVDHLERALATAQTQLVRAQTAREQETSRLLKENTKLLEEINRLRAELLNTQKGSTTARNGPVNTPRQNMTSRPRSQNMTPRTGGGGPASRPGTAVATPRLGGSNSRPGTGNATPRPRGVNSRPETGNLTPRQGGAAITPRPGTSMNAPRQAITNSKPGSGMNTPRQGTNTLRPTTGITAPRKDATTPRPQTGPNKNNRGNITNRPTTEQSISNALKPGKNNLKPIMGVSTQYGDSVTPRGTNKITPRGMPDASTLGGFEKSEHLKTPRNLPINKTVNSEKIEKRPLTPTARLVAAVTSGLGETPRLGTNQDT